MKIRISFAALACLSIAQPAWADARDEAYAGVMRCASIADDRVWLNCMYGAQQPMRAKLGLPPAPDSQLRVVPPAGAAASLPPAIPSQATSAYPPTTQFTSQPANQLDLRTQPRRRGGLFQTLGGNAPPIAASALSAVTFDKRGAFIVTLQNGEVWREIEPGLQKAPLKVGTRVTIRPGALWSYNLQINGSKKSYKVDPQD